MRPIGPRCVAMAFVLIVQALALASSCAVAQEQQSFSLHPEERIVFYGDSITQQALYPAYIETYVLTRFPALDARFIDSGWNGDWVVGGGGGTIDERLARDVIAFRPTMVTVMLGMNDGSYQKFDSALFEVYSKGYLHLVESLQKALPDLRITLLQPSPFDDLTRAPQFEGGYNAVLVRYGQFVSQLANEKRLDTVDMNAALTAVLEKAKTADPAVAEQIIPDRIHPSAGGHLVLAAVLLKAWHAPSMVSAVEIDAAHGQIRRADNTRLANLDKHGLSWTEEDTALPLPIDWKDPVIALAARSSDVVETLDQQWLKVTGLTGARYILKIDEEDVGTWTAQDLAHGINLALVETPMLRQSKTVFELALRHYTAHLARWQGVQVTLQKENSPYVRGALSTLDKLEDDLIGQERLAASPKPHRFELRDVSLSPATVVGHEHAILPQVSPK